MTNKIFRHVVRNEEGINFTKSEIDINTIETFGIFVRKSYTTKGKFKAFYKSGYIRTNNGNQLSHVPEDEIRELKPLLKVKSEKINVEEYKNYDVKRTVEWHYTVIR